MQRDEKDRRELLRKSKPSAYKKVMDYENQLAKGRSIAMIQIQPGYACNMRCLHCSVSCFRGQKRRKMTTDDIYSLCNQMDEYGLAQIDLTGGEPLVFPNLFNILSSIGTSRFYLSLATNGWHMTEDKALELKEAGVDRILLSLDSLGADAHDKMRNKEGAYLRAIDAIGHVKRAKMDLKLTSVITHERARSAELEAFVDFTKSIGARIEALPPRLVGEWQGRTDLLLTKDDFAFLQDAYGMTFHTSPHFGINMGCVAVKKIITITAYGDVMPCIWMYYSLGNIFDSPLRDIIAKGMKYFGAFHATCRLADDADFIDKYNSDIKDKQLPIKIEDATAMREGL